MEPHPQAPKGIWRLAEPARGGRGQRPGPLRLLGRRIGPGPDEPRRPLPPPDPRSIQAIVVWVLAPLGDTLFATPALHALREGFPSATITGVCWAANRDLLATNPDVDEWISCANSADLPRALSVVQNRPVDLSVGLSNVGSYLAAFHQVPYRIGFHSESLGWLWDFHFPEQLSGHAVDYCLSIVRALGVDTRQVSRRPQLWLLPEDRAWADAFLAAEGWQAGQTLIAIHPGGSHFAAKRWPLRDFSRLIDVLLADPTRQVVLIGGRDDQRLAERIIAGMSGQRRPLIAAGRARLRRTAALLERSAVMVGNDSGPLHMAAAVDTPVVALFGPTSPDNFRPLSSAQRVIWKALPCSPCFRFLGGIQQYWPRQLNPRCRRECMSLITVEEVVEAINELVRVSAGASYASEPLRPTGH
ncbi:MAG: glycosyltransferase family 9 protein [Limnochordaceae bacterium]|nr:glycosyltransferase family 9 protein [Limnochordaceae bacterium]